MESKEGSVKKLIRVHLNSHKLSTQKRKKAELISSTNTRLRKVTFKSPEVLIKLIQKENKQNGRCNSIESMGSLSKLKTTNFDSNNCFSQKHLLETTTDPRSSTDIKQLESPKQPQNKMKRIKSQQSMALHCHFQSVKKRLSKYKVMVHNPFEPKQSKSTQEEMFNQSQIFKNQSRISNDGRKELTHIISLI